MEKNYITEKLKKSNRGENFENHLFSQAQQIELFLFGWIGFQILAILFSFFASLLTPKIDQLMLLTINCASYGNLFVILCIVIGPNGIKTLGKQFTKLKPYMAGLLCFILIIMFNNAYGSILKLINTPISNNANETNVESMTNNYFIPSLIFFGFIGPICEELTYRVGLFSLCKRKSKVFAYIVTIIVFAFIHFDFETNNLVNELLNLPYYAFAAFAFSFTYDNFGFAGSASAHLINNIFSICGTYLLQ